MKIFNIPKGEPFNKETKIYKDYLYKYIKLMADEAENELEVKNNNTFQQYIKVCHWPIRQLEYSYVIGECIDVKKSSIEEELELLDAGCGVTPLPFLLGNEGYKVEAIDFSEEDINLMRKIKNGKNFPGSKKVSYQTRNIISLPYDDSKFDVITCVSVLEHIDFPLYLLALIELYRVLKPGGKLIFTVDIWLKGSRKDCFFEGGFNKLDIMDFMELFSGKTLQGADNKIELISEDVIKEFWESHWFDGIGYEGNREYLSIGFTIKKEDNKHAYLKILSRFLTIYLKNSDFTNRWSQEEVIALYNSIKILAINEYERYKNQFVSLLNNKTKIIEEIEKDRQDRLEVIEKQQKIIEEIEKDRQDRLEVIEKQQKIIEELEKRPN